MDKVCSGMFLSNFPANPPESPFSPQTSSPLIVERIRQRFTELEQHAECPAHVIFAASSFDLCARRAPACYLTRIVFTPQR